jgi:hypothetical protein
LKARSDQIEVCGLSESDGDRDDHCEIEDDSDEAYKSDKCGQVSDEPNGQTNVSGQTNIKSFANHRVAGDDMKSAPARHLEELGSKKLSDFEEHPKPSNNPLYIYISFLSETIN